MKVFVVSAGGSPGDRQNLPEPGPGSMPPTMEVNSLSKSMHPQPPPSMMHPPPPTMMGGAMGRPPFNPPPSNFMPPFMPGMPPQPAGRPGPGATPPVGSNNDHQGRPGGHFGPPPPPTSGVGPNAPPPGPPVPGYHQPPQTSGMTQGPPSGPGMNHPPPPTTAFTSVSGGDSSKQSSVFNGMHPLLPSSSTATSNSNPSSNIQQGPAMGPPPPQGMMPPPMGGPHPSMQSMTPMNIPRGQMMYPGARYSMPSMPKGSSTPLQAPSSGDGPPSSSANPATFNPVPSYGSSPFMPPTNYPAPRGYSVFYSL